METADRTPEDCHESNARKGDAKDRAGGRTEKNGFERKFRNYSILEENKRINQGGLKTRFERKRRFVRERGKKAYLRDKKRREALRSTENPRKKGDANYRGGWEVGTRNDPIY